MVQELFRAAACLHGRRTAVVGHSGRLSYRALEYEALRLAHRLRRLGARRGDRVAVMMVNSAEAAVAIWATLEAGCVLVPLHAATRPDALAPVLRDAEPRWIIASRELAAAFPAMRDAVPGLERLLVWTTASPAPVDLGDQTVQWQLRVRDTEPTSIRSGLPIRRSPDGLAALLYTSGTTGEPKAAMLSHANMRAGLRAVNDYLQVESTDVLYSALPLSSSYGLYQLLLGLAVGATVVLDRTFAFPAQSLALIARERATVFAGVPTMYAWMAATPLLGQYDLSSLRILTSAAASLPLEHARRIRERLPGARLYVMYGQTECKRISYLDPEDFERKPGSVGRGMFGQEHRLVDEESRVVGPGEVGELVVRGPHVMQGYWRNPAATALKLKPIGGDPAPWLHTGDLFTADEDGYLYFVGRRDDLLKIGGHKVSPRQVEEVLCQMPEVREAAVVGVPHPEWGEAVQAHVVLHDGAQCDANAVARFCKLRLRAYMVPRTVVFERDLPRTESGKIKKRALLERAEARVEAIQA